MSVEKYLIEQFSAHPSMQPQDVVKLCYQSAFGAEHLLQDFAAAEKYFMDEFEAVSALVAPLFENISDDFARVNISAWKKLGLPANWLFNMFRLSAVQNDTGREKILEYLDLAENLVHKFSFSKEEWQSYVNSYKESGMPSVHHSEIYRAAEKPAYRIVRRSLLRFLPILEKAAECKAKPCVISIDGRAGSGKSTLAADLAAVLEADIVHMDDFFLPQELRSQERLGSPGGNIHHERFAEEVLTKLHRSEAFSYNVFSCSRMQLDGRREVADGDFRIVEGSYSLHPDFGDYADVSVFCHVEPQEQLRRLRARDGERFTEVFRKYWIPMEENYFETFDIISKCDVIM